MSIIKKICFSLIITVIFFIFLEFAARTYHAIKYKNAGVYSYGLTALKGTVQSLFTKTVKTAEDYDYIEMERMADEAFAKRAVRHGIKELSPVIITQWGYPARINNMGFRGPDISIEKPADTVRIAAMGGSFVNCVGVSDDETWGALLQKELDRKAEGKFEIINAGQGATTVDGILIKLVDRVTALKPDYLLFISAYNNHNLLRAEVHHSLAWRMSKFMYNISLVYAMVRERLALKIYKDNNYFIYNYDVHVSTEEVAKLLKRYRKRLEEILIVCGENKIIPILGMQPEFIPNGLTELQDFFDEAQINRLSDKLNKQSKLAYYELEYYLQSLLNKELKLFAIKNGILLFDGVSVFPRDKYPFFIDQIHLNKKGTSLFAAGLYDFLVKEKIAKKIETP